MDNGLTDNFDTPNIFSGCLSFLFNLIGYILIYFL
jgi:hypothetical protein